ARVESRDGAQEVGAVRAAPESGEQRGGRRERRRRCVSPSRKRKRRSKRHPSLTLPARTCSDWFPRGYFFTPVSGWLVTVSHAIACSSRLRFSSSSPFTAPFNEFGTGRPTGLRP